MMDLDNAGLLGVGNSANSINLQGNSNFLTVKGDSVSSYLPFYGERHMNVGYGGRDSAIEFDGEMKNYRAEWDEAKQRYNITFNAKSNNENFGVQLILFPNNSSAITLTGSSRSTIRYTGKVSAVKEDVL